MNLILKLSSGENDPMPCCALLDTNTLQMRQTNKIVPSEPANLVILDLKQADALREWLNKNLPR